MAKNDISWDKVSKFSEERIEQDPNNKEKIKKELPADSSFADELKDVDKKEPSSETNAKQLETYKRLLNFDINHAVIVGDKIIIRKDHTLNWIEGMIDFSSPRPKVTVKGGVTGLSWFLAIAVVSWFASGWLLIIYASYKKYGRMDDLKTMAYLALSNRYDLAYESIGNDYFEEKQYETAIKFYNKALVENPKFGKAYQDMAEAYTKLNKKDKANECLEKLKKLSKK